MEKTLIDIIEKFKAEYHLTIEQVSGILEWTPRTYSNYKNGSSDGTNPKVIQHVNKRIEAVRKYLQDNPTLSIDDYLGRLKSPAKTENENTTIASQQSTIHMLVAQQNKLIHQHQQLIDKLLSCDMALPFGVTAKTKTPKTKAV